MSTVPDLSKVRALVIDDNVDAATSLSVLLQLIGCTTATAFGGETGLRVAQLFQPNLIFVDLDMPGPDGCELVAQVKKGGGPLAEALFVCLTGRSEQEDQERCFAAGFDLFFSKPIDPAAMQAVLAEAHRRANTAPLQSRRAL